MIQRARGRLIFILVGIGVCFVGIEIKLFHLQILSHSSITKEASGMYRAQETMLGTRGRVLSRRGLALAASMPAVEIYSDSRWTEGHVDELVERLSPLISEEELNQPLRDRIEMTGYRRLLSRPVADADRAAQLWSLKNARALPGIDLVHTWVRSHPEGRAASQIVGYVNTEGNGQAGVELAFDNLLTGDSGYREILRDVARRPLFRDDGEVEEARRGHDVRLTIDLVIQHFAEEAIEELNTEHQPNWCSAVVMDPKTGEVLAMASRPDFDPGDYRNADVSTFQNPAVSYTYTPGSAFKPFIMAEALDQMAVRLDERIDCSSFAYDGRTIRDSHVNGLLTPAEIIIESSNIGMSKIALRLVPDKSHPRESQLAGFRRIRQSLADLGFGRETNLGLRTEVAGSLSPASRWTHKYTLPSISFGHEIAVTPLQMAAAFSVFANGGVYMEPYIVESIIDHEGRHLPRPPRTIRQVIDPIHAETIREMLVGVVDEGTGKRVAIDGYSVAGKTSTAQWEKDKSKYTVSFVGFAPASDPQLLALIVVDQPSTAVHSGGQVAGPAARHILEKGLAYLRIPRDRKAIPR